MIMQTIFSGKKLTVPNLLSFSRILMIPWFIRVYMYHNNCLGAAMILLLSGFTDIIDGAIARRFNMVSNLGKALDPVADKLTQIAILFCLLTRFPHMWAMTITLCVKELFIMITSLVSIHRTDEVPQADWHGKLTTAAIYAAMITHLLFPGILGTLSDILICVCVCLILISGILYGIRNIRQSRLAG